MPYLQVHPIFSYCIKLKLLTEILCVVSSVKVYSSEVEWCVAFDNQGYLWYTGTRWCPDHYPTPHLLRKIDLCSHDPTKSTSIYFYSTSISCSDTRMKFKHIFRQRNGHISTLNTLHYRAYRAHGRIKFPYIFQYKSSHMKSHKNILSWGTQSNHMMQL